MDDTESLVEGLIKEGTLIKATLSSPRKKQAVHKVIVRPLTIKNQVAYQFSYHYAQKVVHKNISLEQVTKVLISELFFYKQAILSTSSKNYHLLFNNKGEATILQKPVTNPLKQLSHNRAKNYLLKEGFPIPFLIELGVMSSSGKILAQKYDKFRQMNRFLEMIDDVLPHLPKDKTLRIIDFGCGKAYLTFALYHFLHLEKKYDLEIIGLDLKADVVSFCQNVADKLGFSQLRFLEGDIRDYPGGESIDMMVCLHACDTATDAALQKAVDWGAKVILAVPCCQHELYEQVKCIKLKPLLSQGILKERFAALVTDAARAHFLEILGYKTQILEFIDMEHTPKNLLIRAVYHPSSEKKTKLIEEYKTFKKFLHITPSIEKYLNNKIF